MIIATWKILDNKFNSQQFAHQFNLTTDAIIKRGDKNIVGKVIRISGCYILIPVRGDSMNSLLNGINRFIARHRSAFILLKRTNISSMIHIGVGVGSDKHYTRNVVLNNKLLTLLSKLGVDVAVTAYPVSDE